MRQGYRNYSVFGYRPVQASGGTVTDILVDGRPYRVHRFLSTGSSTFTVHNTGSDPSADYLVVGGGGSGGHRLSGGGGAGGFLEGQTTLSTGNYSILVGAGGQAAVNQQVGFSGGNSVFGTIIATGGGGGGGYNGSAYVAGSNGASGGGGSASSMPGGLGISGQGFAGGSGNITNWSGDSGYSSGGGGGAGSAGTNGIGGGPTVGVRGNGGAGKTSSITGTVQSYAGGGGGHQYRNIDTASSGGSGVGGNGGITYINTSSGLAPTSGAPNTGSGGGGGGFYQYESSGSNAGGSGVVIVRYPTGPSVPLPYMTATGGTERIYQDLLSQRINLATDPSFELTTGGWEPSNSGSSVERTTAKYYSGTSSVRVYQRFFGNSIEAGTLVSCVAGRTYSISFKLWLKVGRSITVRSDATNANYGPFIPISGTDNWQTVTINNVYATGNQVGVIFFSNDTLLTEAFIDELIVEESSTVGTYFDGSSPGCSWSGTPNASTSISNQIATYKSHTFTATGSSTFQVTELGVAPYGSEIQYMLVGGGGSGRAAGGGAGGVIVSSATIRPSVYNIFVGSGGPRLSSGTPSSGGSTTLTGTGIAATTAFGGGMGGSSADAASVNGSYGGSGGGAAFFWNGSSNIIGIVGLGEPGQGYDGSLSRLPPYQIFFGSGGGAGSSGFITGIGTSSGGDGISNNYFDGTIRHYAGGGFGSQENQLINNIYGGGGTSGSPSYEGLDGTPSTGSGGGGVGGAGGSGIVVIRYRIA